MKKIFLLFLVLVCSSVARADDSATAFTKKFAGEALDKILTKDEPLIKKYELFDGLFVKNVSMDMVANFALGRKMKSLSEAEKEKFKTVFEKNMILMWTLRFTEYKGQKIEFTGEKTSENGKDVFVDSKIIDENKKSDPAIDVIWRIRKDDKDLKIIDIVISNISMLKTYQTEYSSFLNQNGGDINALIKMLETKNENYLKEINTK